MTASLLLRGLSPADSARCLRLEAGRELPDELAGEAFDMTSSGLIAGQPPSVAPVRSVAHTMIRRSRSARTT